MILLFKSYKKTFILFSLFIAILLYFLYKYNNILNQRTLDILVSNQVQIAQNELENQKNQALSLALMFSKNQDIIKNLEESNHIELKKELVKLIEIIKTYTKHDIDIQIHTKDLEVFTRSWEDKDFGLKLESFREGLVKVKNTKEPYVSSELGKRFNIKAIAPIFDKNSIFIGSVEVIVDFSFLIERLKAFGIGSIVLLETKYLDIAKYHNNNKVLENFVVLQNSFNKTLFETLSKNTNYLKNDKFYYETNDRIITQIPLGSFENNSVGVLVICFDKNINNFSYLPKYDYLGDITVKQEKKDFTSSQRKEIIIK
ncbi:cache domain-containing protein [Aliarcobacter vitoriensis]|uniref:Chemotaxis protein n=1 Tax=Aliarcobacter vitoriensis TaxID=2011099 RepID=A0A366MP90_9BACT|nr:cache domain-containing protein [Aliarcobacter vitoriensis]RBQ28076.1 chemotaxis protein [Aliarcobacter vitoriensis]